MYNVETDDIIGQYIIFCHVMDEQIKKYGRVKEAVIEAMRICRDRNVLRDYLKEREKEVVDIMTTIFTQEYAVNQYAKAMKNEGRKEGRKEGRNELAQLFAKLFDLGKTDEAVRASKDPKYRQELLKEYGFA